MRDILFSPTKVSPKGNYLENPYDNIRLHFAKGGSIHVWPFKKRIITVVASKHGKGAQEFASKVLVNKEKKCLRYQRI